MRGISHLHPQTSSIELRSANDVLEAYGRPGPHATVAVDSPRPGERADAHQTRWHALSHSLSEWHATERTIDILRNAVAGLSPDGARYVITANDSGARHRRIGVPAGESAGPVAFVGRAPRLVPALFDVQRSSFNVIGALVDRVGADLFVGEDGGFCAPDGERVSIEGDSEFIHRGAHGGWSQHRFQVRAEQVWEINGARVAEKLAELAERHQAVGIVVSGDVRAAHFVIAHLPSPCRPLARYVHTGGRHEPDSPTRLNAEMVRVSGLGADDVVDRAFGRVAAAGRRRVDELGATAQALRVHDIEELLVESTMPRHDWLDFVVHDALRNQVPVTVTQPGDDRLGPSGIAAVARSARVGLSVVSDTSRGGP